jgi:transposase-like protein
MKDNVGLYELPGGEILPRNSATVIDLPPPDTKRWVARRKAVIVNAVRSGAVSLEEVCRRYELSVEEFLAWQRAIETHGVAGLRVTRLQIYRDTPPARLSKPRY